MNTEFNCPQCRQLLAIAPKYAGTNILCSKCGGMVQVPEVTPTGEAVPPGQTKPLSPEEKQRTYEEEKTRVEAREKASKELERKKTMRNCLGCFGVIAVILVIAVVWMAIPSGGKQKARYQSPANGIPSDPGYISEFSKNTAAWVWKHSSFYTDLNFTVKTEAPVDDKKLIGLGMRKLVGYNRPGDRSVAVYLFVDEEEHIMMSALQFRKTDKDYFTWVRALLSLSDIEERDFGQNYPLNFVQGSVMQNKTSSAKIAVSAWTYYVVECTNREKSFMVSVMKYSADKQKTRKQEAQIILPSYSILNEEVYEVPGKAQVEIKMLVSGQISEAGLRLLLNKTYISVKSRKGFKYHDSPTVIAIYAFTSKEKANSGTQWIGMLIKGPRDGPTVSISKDTLSLYQSPPKPEEKFGLSETRRKQIFQEYIKVEDKAMIQAEKKHPLNTDAYLVGEYPSDSELREINKKNEELMRSLQEQYKNQIAKKCNISREQLEQICIEGVNKDWPMPVWGP